MRRTTSDLLIGLVLLLGGLAAAAEAPPAEPTASAPPAAEAATTGPATADAATTEALPAADAAATEGEAEPPRWSCETCPYQTGWQGAWGADLSFASGVTGWSTRAHPLDDGANLGLVADLVRLDEDGTRVDVVVRDLGLDDAAASVTIGRADAYRAGFDYWSKRWVTADGARTPFEGVGSGVLALPAGWVRGSSTADMTELAASLHPVEMATRRERVGAHGTWWSRNGWATSLEARHETKSGTEAIGGAFLTRATLLPEPIDQTTESLVASAAYGAKHWDVSLRYLLSTFDSGATSLQWDDPFVGSHPTADAGQMALAPDNEFQQVAVDGRYRTAGGVRLEAGVALGFGTQDATLLPATLNPGLATALPRASADAEVATRLLFARAAVPMGPGVALRAELRYDARDADTPRDLWDQVVTDTYLGSARPNVAYGHEKTRFKVEGDWLLGGVRFLARAQSLLTDRDQEVVARTDEDSLTLEAHGALFDALDWGVEVGHDAREGSPYAAPGGAAPQNPLLRMFPYADLERDRVALTLGAAPTAALSFALRLERNAEDYDETQVGLTARDDTGVGFDLSYAIAEDMSFGAFYQRQTLASDQAGSSAYAAPDWAARSEDATEAVGLSFAAPYLTERLGLRAEFNLTEATGLVTVDQGATDAFPETLSRLRQFVVMADLRQGERVTWRFGFRLEDLATADWALAGVDPATVPTLLWSGQREPDYELEVFELGVKIGL